MKIFYWITLVLILFVTYSSGNLSWADWHDKAECPKILTVPACYIVFFCFCMAAISHILNTPKMQITYFVFVGIPFFIALIGSITELAGVTVCPKTASGIPMCYISLGFCIALLVTKYLSLKS